MVDLFEQEPQEEPGQPPEDPGESAASAPPPPAQGGKLRRHKGAREREFSKTAVACYLLATYILGGAQAYTLSYFDCHNPLQVEKVDETAACTTNGPREERPTYAVVSDITDGEFRG